MSVDGALVLLFSDGLRSHAPAISWALLALYSRLRSYAIAHVCGFWLPSMDVGIATCIALGTLLASCCPQRQCEFCIPCGTVTSNCWVFVLANLCAVVEPG